VRTAEAARIGLAEGLTVAFNSGAVTGLLVVGLGLLGVAGYYAFLTAAMGLSVTDPAQSRIRRQPRLVALGFGASLISIFARLGGGTFHQGRRPLAATWWARSKRYSRRRSAQTRRPLPTMSATMSVTAPVWPRTLFETYAVTTVATMVLASIFFMDEQRIAMMVYPLAIAGAASSPQSPARSSCGLARRDYIIGRALQGGSSPTGALSLAIPVAGDPIGSSAWNTEYAHSRRCTLSPAGILYFCGVVGLVVTGLIVWITEYYTGTNFRPVQSVAKGLGDGSWHERHSGLAPSRWNRPPCRPSSSCGGIISTLSVGGVVRHRDCRDDNACVAGMIVALDAFGQSPTTPAASRKWPASKAKCARRPTHSTRSATPRKR
jgi:K(+)-stimulated pyrophosphate-energized sodium pump